MKEAIDRFDRDFYPDGGRPGGIADDDFDVIRKGIDEVKPKIFIETGAGRSTELIFGYLRKKHTSCQFYTIDPICRFLEEVEQKFRSYSNFNAFLGLSVGKKDLVAPAVNEYENYPGPENVLIEILSQNKFRGHAVDMMFIDSREGSAVAEFKIVEKHLSAKAIVLCHDVFNGGTGYELQEYLKDRPYKCIAELTSAGILRVEKN